MGECLIIRTSGGVDTENATANTDHILSGYTAYVKDNKVTGSMANRGSVTSSLNPGESYTVEEGYYNGTGSISVSSLSSNTSGNATASQILNSYVGWINGTKVTGSMVNHGAKTWTLTPNTSGVSSQTIGGGYHNGSGKISQSLTTVAGSTTTPGTANKTLAAASRWVSGNLIVAGNSNLVSGNIKKGVSIFGVKGTFADYVSGDFILYQNNVFYTAYDESLGTTYSSATHKSTCISVSIGNSSNAWYGLRLRTPSVAGYVHYNLANIKCYSNSESTAVLWHRATLGNYENGSFGSQKLRRSKYEVTSSYTSSNFNANTTYTWVQEMYSQSYDKVTFDITKIWFTAK